MEFVVLEKIMRRLGVKVNRGTHAFAYQLGVDELGLGDTIFKIDRYPLTGSYSQIV
jgi:hypothetical protein